MTDIEYKTWARKQIPERLSHLTQQEFSALRRLVFTHYDELKKQIDMSPSKSIIIEGKKDNTTYFCFYDPFDLEELLHIIV